MKNLKIVLCVGVLTCVSFSLAAYANGHQDPKEARERVREDRRELRNALRTADAGATREARDELRKTRKAARMAELQKRYGDVLSVPAAKAEIGLHAKRMAWLHRIEALARVEKKDAFMKRVEVAIAKEKSRHERRMDRVKNGGSDAGEPGGGGGGGAGSGRGRGGGRSGDDAPNAGGGTK